MQIVFIGEKPMETNFYQWTLDPGKVFFDKIFQTRWISANFTQETISQYKCIRQW